MSWDHARESRHARGYGRQWEKLRAQVLQRDRGLCQICLPKGVVRAGNHVDHKVPKSQGGTDDMSNLQVVDEACHRAKTIEEMGGKPRPRVTIGVDGFPK